VRTLVGLTLGELSGGILVQNFETRNSFCLDVPSSSRISELAVFNDSTLASIWENRDSDRERRDPDWTDQPSDRGARNSNRIMTFTNYLNRYSDRPDLDSDRNDLH